MVLEFYSPVPFKRKSKKMPENYYAAASRKLRQRRKDLKSSLQTRNDFLEKDMVVLKKKMASYQGYVENIGDKDNEYYLKMLENENTLLKTEINLLKEIEKKLIPLLSSFEQIEKMTKFNSFMNKNIHTMMEQLMNVAWMTARNVDILEGGFFTNSEMRGSAVNSTIYEEIVNRFHRGDRRCSILDELQHQEKSYSCRYEIRETVVNGVKCCRIDVYDLPIPVEFLEKKFRAVESTVWPMFALARPEAKTTGANFALTFCGETEDESLSRFDPTLLTVKCKVIPQEFSLLMAKDVPQSITADHFPVNDGPVRRTTIIGHAVVPGQKSAATNFEGIEILETSLFRGSIIREGSDCSKSHLTLISRCFYPKTNFNSISEVEKRENARIVFENLCLVKSINENGGREFLAPKLNVLVNSCVIAHELDISC